MQIEVKIDQDAVQQQVVQAIMDSAIGSNIQKYITEALTKSGDFRDPRTMVQKAVDSAVASQLAQIANELIATKKDAIRAQMLELLTDDVIDKMCSSAWAVMNARLVERN
jgi:FKBP-type peptidyl-prolyl cis-trans isomerase (trigger factor)